MSSALLQQPRNRDRRIQCCSMQPASCKPARGLRKTRNETSDLIFIPDPSLNRRPIVSGFSSGSSKLPFYYCGTGADGSWTGHEKTTFCGCISEDRESVFGLPTLCSVLARGRRQPRSSKPKQTQRLGRWRPSQGRCAKMFLIKRVTFHCNMQDVDSKIEIGMRNVFLTIVV